MKLLRAPVVSILVLLLSSNISLSQSDWFWRFSIGTTQSWNLRGKVSRITEVSYSKGRTGNSEKDLTIDSQIFHREDPYFLHFDNKGRFILETLMYTPENDLDTITHFNFENDRLISILFSWDRLLKLNYGDDGLLESANEYVLSYFDKNNIFFRESFLYAAHKFEYSNRKLVSHECHMNRQTWPENYRVYDDYLYFKIVYQYDDQGRILSKRYFEVDQVVRNHKLVDLAYNEESEHFKYNENGQLISVRFSNGRQRNHSKQELTEYIYENDELIEIRTTSKSRRKIESRNRQVYANGRLISEFYERTKYSSSYLTTYQYELDSIGNWIQKEKYVNGILSERTTRSIEYYD